jgi:hypothetical protein
MKNTKNVGQTVAEISECIGGEWFVCVEKFAAKLNQYGEQFVETQITQTFKTKYDAVIFIVFSEDFAVTSFKIKEGERAFYLDEGKFQFAND